MGHCVALAEIITLLFVWLTLGWMVWRHNTNDKRTMSTIKDYTYRVNLRLDGINNGLTGLTDAVTDIAGDLAFLKETILKLQNNPGPISAEDQALLDELEARITTAEGRTNALAASASALAATTTAPEVPPDNA